MRYEFINFFKNLSINNFGFILFLLGVFFLPSTLAIGIIFLLPSAIIGSFLQRRPYFQDKWNYPFFIFGFLILMSSIIQNLFLNNNYIEIWDPSLSIVGLGNWLPFIWFFWTFQPYLDTKIKRRLLGIILICGTFPVLITGFGQYFFNWTGPFKTLNGLIIWYQRPIQSPGGLSGLFNNQNYAGSWLNLVWPFCLALYLEKRNNIFRKTIIFSFLISVGFAAFLTYSRNAWLGLITSLPIVLGKRLIKLFFGLLIITLVIFIFSLTSINNGSIQDLIINHIPRKLLLEFYSEGYEGLNSTRLEIYSSALNLIKENPFFGIGAASFTPIFLLETNFWKGHSHNLLLELSISYGLPSAIIFLITTIIILLLSINKILKNEDKLFTSIFDRAIWASLFFFLISQLLDIQYFDGKISIIAWILLSSLKNIIEGSSDTTKIA